jgi:hypothetical protein
LTGSGSRIIRSEPQIGDLANRTTPTITSQLHVRRRNSHRICISNNHAEPNPLDALDVVDVITYEG